jgi:group I intron endonuclease
MNGIIYLIRNRLNGKGYVGQTTEQNFKSRMSYHRYEAKDGNPIYLYKAIRKYGWHSFETTIIEHTDFPDEREVYWIKELNTLAPNGYNLTTGGKRGQFYSLAVRQRMSLIARINMQDPARREHLRKLNTGVNNPNYGTHRTTAHKRQIASGTCKKYEVVTPEGKCIIFTNLSEFCRLNNLSRTSMKHLMKGRYTEHRGYTTLKRLSDKRGQK